MVALVLFVGVIAGAIVANWLVVEENIGRLGFGLFALVAAVSVVGFSVPRFLKASDREAKTISVETGVQNGALALAISALLVADGPAFNAFAIPAAGAVRPMRTSLYKDSQTAPYDAPRPRHSARAAARLSLKLARE